MVIRLLIGKFTLKCKKTPLLVHLIVFNMIRAYGVWSRIANYFVHQVNEELKLKV